MASARPASLAIGEVQVVQGTGSGGAPSSRSPSTPSPDFLLRQGALQFRRAVGRLPTQVDYSDYRDVAGVKLPFKWTVTWLDGKDTVELKEVRSNVAVDAAWFSKPSPPAR